MQTHAEVTAAGKLQKGTFTVGKVRVVIENDVLTVNGVAYGNISGARGIVADRGKVRIDGIERKAGNAATQQSDGAE